MKCHGVFAIFVPEESTIVGFADDQTVTVTAKHLKDVEVYATETAKAIKSWLEGIGLILADEKRS